QCVPFRIACRDRVGQIRTTERKRPYVVSNRPESYDPSVDILAAALDRLRFSGTLLFHYELCRPWGLSVPQFPEAVFHYRIRSSSTVALPGGRKRSMEAGDLIVLTRGEPHLLYSDAFAKPYPLLDLERPPAHGGVIHHGGKGKPPSTMLCG